MFNDTATTQLYTLSLHDALPIFFRRSAGLLAKIQTDEEIDQEICPDNNPITQRDFHWRPADPLAKIPPSAGLDRKSTRLNSSHSSISYAVFCLKKKNIEKYLN